MPMFGGKHFSNPAVGRMHGKMDDESAEPKGLEDEKAEGEHPKSVHGHFHEDGTAHVHVHKADGTHEHVDHATHEDAHEHMKSAMGGGESFEQWAKEEAEEPEHMGMKETVHASGGAF